MFGKIFSFSVFLVYLKIIKIEGFNCLACQNTLDDQTCLENPVNSGAINCGDNGWCTTYRLELTDIPGEVKLFNRGCSRKKPIHENNVQTNALYTAYYRSCQFHMCNDGTAREPGEGGGLPIIERIIYINGSKIHCLNYIVILSSISFYSVNYIFTNL